jgi:hypothetical protein
MPELVMLAGFVVGMYGLAQLLKPPIRQKYHPRVSLLILLAGLGVAYLGLSLSGEENPVEKVREEGLPYAPKFQFFKKGE